MIKKVVKSLAALVAGCGLLLGVCAPLVAQESEARGGIETLEKIKDLDQLLLLIQKRLSVMHEVARWKWINHSPIEDREREEKILKGLAAKAETHGLDREFAFRFFREQIEAAKHIQGRDFDLWQRQRVGWFGDVLDLHTEIRPYLDNLTEELLRALRKVKPHLGQAIQEGLLLEEPLSLRDLDFVEEDIWQMAVCPLLVEEQGT